MGQDFLRSGHDTGGHRPARAPCNYSGDERRELSPKSRSQTQTWPRRLNGDTAQACPLSKEDFMYREVAQWRHVRRSILEKGTPKKQVARDTGISRRAINKMLMHENPPRYGPRPPLYPKLGPYTSAIDELISSTPAADLTIRDIVERLRREHGFAGSYDSVRN